MAGSRNKRKRVNGQGEWRLSPTGTDGRGERTFTAYYKAQLMGSCLADETEWDAIMEAFRKPLPATFRFTATPGHVARLETELENLVAKARAQQAEESPEEPAAVRSVAC